MFTRNLFLALVLALGGAPLLGAGLGWPQFRGPQGRGIAEGAEPPTEFGVATNLLWQVALPEGNSSPVVWGDKIFLTALNSGRLETLCLDRARGQILWRQTAPTEKIEPAHTLGSPATPTPITDGKRLYVYFGSFGLLAYDLGGKELWRLPLPAPMVEFGAAASPVLAGNRLFQVCDQDLGSFLLAANAETGETIWKTERPQFRRSFATPFVWRHQGEEELVVPGSVWLKSYDLANGHEKWSYTGTSRVACATPTGDDSLLFSSSWNVGGDEGSRITMPPFAEFALENDKNKDGFLTQDEIPAGPIRDRFTQIDLNKDKKITAEEWQTLADMFEKASNALIAIQPGGKGDITATHVAWKKTRSLPYVSSPLFYQGRVYTVKNGGMASCYEASSGKALYSDERLGARGDYYASAVASHGKVYLASQEGIVTVLQAGDTFKILAQNKLPDPIFATPAIVDGEIYARTRNNLFAFGPRK